MNNTSKYGADALFLDAEEKALVTGFENAVEEGVISSHTFAEQEAVRDEWKDVLKNTLQRKAVTLRLQERDIRRVKAIARELGMPYQTYLASIIHQVASGRIVVK